MNTIRKARKRPRVRSVNFKTLGWLIRRVAAYNVLVRAPLQYTKDPFVVRWRKGQFADDYTTDDLARIVSRVLDLYPRLRTWPPNFLLPLEHHREVTHA